jgi:hypothetical protein
MWPSSRSEILYRWKKYLLLGVKKAKIGSQSPKTEFGAQNQYIRVIYPSIGNITCSKKKHTLRGQKGEAFRSQKRNLGPNINMIVWHIYRLGILHGIRKNVIFKINAHTYILFGVKKAKIRLRRPKTKLRPVMELNFLCLF